VVANSLVLHDLSFRHIWKRPNTTHKVTPLQGAYHCLKGTARWRDTVWFFFYKCWCWTFFAEAIWHFNLFCKRNLTGARTHPHQGHFFLSGYIMKNPEEEDLPWRTTPKIHEFWGLFFMGVLFAPCSWFGNHPTKKLPRVGGFLTINLWPRYQMYLPDKSCKTCALATPLMSTCSLCKKENPFIIQ